MNKRVAIALMLNALPNLTAEDGQNLVSSFASNESRERYLIDSFEGEYLAKDSGNRHPPKQKHPKIIRKLGIKRR